jgi:hypothetical protein
MPRRRKKQLNSNYSPRLERSAEQIHAAFGYNPSLTGDATTTLTDSEPSGLLSEHLVALKNLADELDETKQMLEDTLYREDSLRWQLKNAHRRLAAILGTEYYQCSGCGNLSKQPECLECKGRGDIGVYEVVVSSSSSASICRDPTPKHQQKKQRSRHSWTMLLQDRLPPKRDVEEVGNWQIVSRIK